MNKSKARQQMEACHEDASKQHDQAEKALFAARKARKGIRVAERRMADAREYVLHVHEWLMALIQVEYDTKYPPIASSSVTFGGYLQRDSVDWKRFYLDGITISAKCSTCGGPITRISGDYLSYPKMGQSTTIGLWCDGCYEANEVGYNGHTTTGRIMVRIEADTEDSQ